ncbi:MAG TPA: CHAP domain-containing protein [Gaiellaceae bacterium]|nr:CHAP domain-containing protein [Gaiellaceae bacterium]
MPSCRPSFLSTARRLPVCVALVVAVGICAAGAEARGPVIGGYPYATRCPQAGEEEVVDRWGMYACNCTSYVAWALHANRQRTGWFVRGSMDAWNWPNVARRKGFRVASTPRVGAVAVWPKLDRPFGHVAYVTRLHGDGTFDVAEYNFPGARQHFRFDRRTHLTRDGASFIDVPKRADA